MKNYTDDLKIIEQMCLNDVTQDAILSAIDILKLNKLYAVDDLKSTESILSSTKEKLSTMIKSFKFKYEQFKINRDEKHEKNKVDYKDALSKMEQLKKLRHDKQFADAMRSHLFGFNYNIFLDYDKVITALYKSTPLFDKFISLLKDPDAGNKLNQISAADKAIFDYFQHTFNLTNIKSVESTKTGHFEFIKNPTLQNTSKSYDEWFNIFDHFLNVTYKKWMELDTLLGRNIVEKLYSASVSFSTNVLKKDFEEDYGSSTDLMDQVSSHLQNKSTQLFWDIDMVIWDIRVSIMKKFNSYHKHSLLFDPLAQHMMIKQTTGTGFF